MKIVDLVLFRLFICSYVVCEAGYAPTPHPNPPHPHTHPGTDLSDIRFSK